MSELRYSCMSRSTRAHFIEWTDGVTALVNGSWVEALSVAQGRAQHNHLEQLVRSLHEEAAGLATAASLADRAAVNATEAAAACIVRAETAQRQGKARDE